MFQALFLPRLLVSALAIASFPAAANAGAILTLDQISIVGAPGDLFTITGTVQNSSATPTEDFVSLNPAIFTSPVLTIDALFVPGSLTVDSTYIGDIVRFRINPGASDGSYPTNSFAVSFESINGRTFNSNSVNVAVQVTSSVPEPSTFGLLVAGLAGLGLLHRRRSPRARG